MAVADDEKIVNSGTNAGMDERIRKFLTDKFGEDITKEEIFRGDQQFWVKPEKIFDICQAFLNEDSLDVRFLADITCVDWLGHAESEGGRFEVVYNLCSFKHKYRFFLIVKLPGEAPEVRSLIDLFDGANWMEREIWDMFGITFTDHPDLTKILTPDELEGHPLRKDFPLTWEQPRFSWNKDEPPEVIR